MEMFHMIDVISLIGLPLPTSGRSSYNVQCPCCDSGKSKHLNINLKKEVFRCPKCGVNGGMFDLYSLYTGVPRENVRKALADKLAPQNSINIPSGLAYTPPEDVEAPISDVEVRDVVYSELLSRLSLAGDHRENLIGRGLNDNDIERLGYKSTPVIGMSAIAKKLDSEGYPLQGIPGFYRADDNSWTFIHEQRGILIPVRDMNGYIQGLQIRRDNVSKRKFRWISSSERKDGCHAEGWTHISGKAKPIMLLTEGPMKSDIINTLAGLPVIAVPGVNALTHLRLTLEQLKKEGLVEIKTAFDMDMLTNWHVRNGYNNLLSLLDEMGFKYGTYLWNPKYKGFDDYIWEYFFQKTKSQ